jgi:hypothetical protein
MWGFSKNPHMFFVNLHRCKNVYSARCFTFPNEFHLTLLTHLWPLEFLKVRSLQGLQPEVGIS